MLEALANALWAPATYFKLLLIGVTYPLWWPVLKLMWAETKGAFELIDARAGDLRQVVHRAPGEDPWFHIPRPPRRRIGGATAARAAPSRPAPHRPGALRPAPARAAGPRRRGF
ncbi:MAG: hypothetical protein AB1726_04120 [Planctomycetota bacterium]